MKATFPISAIIPVTQRPKLVQQAILSKTSSSLRYLTRELELLAVGKRMNLLPWKRR